MAMRRVAVDGKSLNKRTADMLRRAEARLGFGLTVVQGSYNSGGVSASAGTHDGGGALDVSVKGKTPAQKREIVRQLRAVGFAAWHRTTDQGPWSEHVHAIAIGDPEASWGARAQVTSYYAGLNGLANHAKDDGPRFAPIPVWPFALPKISLGRAKAQFSAKNPKSDVTAVRRIQNLLNHRLGTDLVPDGQAGAKTRAAWKAWEKKIGAKSPNAVPNWSSLKKLCAGYYSVVPISRKN